MTDGWVCPRCKKVWGPYTVGCSDCNEGCDKMNAGCLVAGGVEITHTPCFDKDELARELLPIIEKALNKQEGGKWA